MRTSRPLGIAREKAEAAVAGGITGHFVGVEGAAFVVFEVEIPVEDLLGAGGGDLAFGAPVEVVEAGRVGSEIAEGEKAEGDLDLREAPEVAAIDAVDFFEEGDLSGGEGGEELTPFGTGGGGFSAVFG